MDHHFAVYHVVREIITPEAINRMLEIDFSERKVGDECVLSQDDKLFLKKVDEGIKKVEGHYVIPLPFREDNVVMPDNRQQAEQSASAHGGFHLTKLTSNKQRVLDTVPAEERTNELRSLDLNNHNLPVERALSVHWHVESNKFGFHITVKDKLLT